MKGRKESRKIEEIKEEKGIYPRFGINNETISKYTQSIDKLPPIVINEDNVLIDGLHRLTVYKAANKEVVEVEVLSMVEERELLLEAIKRNATYGMQLSRDEKKTLAIRLFKDYYVCPECKNRYDIENPPNKEGLCDKCKKELKIEEGLSKEELSDLLSVNIDTIRQWTRYIREKENNKRNAKIIDLWLKCKTYREIADETNLDKALINRVVVSFLENLGNETNPPESIRKGDVWNFSACNKSYGFDFPGRIPGQIIENLLWYYTNPGDVVIDPMAGSGTTIDVCKARCRRYLAFDIHPVRNDIGEHNIEEGYPSKIMKPSLVFIDPPYWSMNKKDYSKDSVSSFSYDDFVGFLDALIKTTGQILKSGGYIAILIQNQTGKDLEGKEYIDWGNIVYNLLVKRKFTPVRRISCPQSSQTLQPQGNVKALKEKRMQGLVRDLLVFTKK